jgi:hypothetical protein
MRFDSVRKMLETKRTSVLEKWRRLIFKTYPPDSVGTLRNHRDRFGNPVGYAINQETGTIFDELLHEMDPLKLATSLENIIRVRAVQDFSPSGAVGIIFALKQVIREELAGEATGKELIAGLLEFEARIDRVALLAFDIYIRCREQIYEIRVNEAVAQRDVAWRILSAAGGGSEADGAE